MSRILRSKLSPITALLIAFLILAVFYSVIVPLFEGPDEDDHFRYARYIGQFRAFPVQPFEQGGGEAGHQGWQPPLYYTLVSILISPIDTSDFQQHLWRNSASTFVGDPACCGRNLYYHTGSENFPYAGTTLAVHVARLLSVLFGALTVWAVYSLVRTILGERPLLAIAAAAVVAFNPTFLFSSALVSNDVPLAAVTTLILLALVKILFGSLSLDWKTGALVGLGLGIALLVKTTALGLVPFALLALFIATYRRKQLSLGVSASAGMLVVMLVISGWWFARNWALYGDPLAYKLMTTSAIFPRSGPLTSAELVQISLPWLWQTFWGGPTPGDFPTGLLGLLAVLAGLGTIGSAVFLARNKSFEVRASFLLLVGWLVFILVAQVQFIRTTNGADQGRYLFPAVGAVALGLVAGWDTLAGLVSSTLQSLVRPLAVAGFLALALFVPLGLTLPAYARPALLSQSDVARIAHPLSANFADRIQLLGYEMSTVAAKPGDAVQVALYWRALAPMKESYRVFVHLVGANDRIGGGADVVPGRGAFPTVYWQEGDTFKDTVYIPVAADVVPGKYAVEVGLYPVGKPDERLAVQGSDDDRVLVSSIKIAPTQNATYSPSIRTGANFANLTELVGYDATPTAGGLGVTLYWQSRTAWERDYTVFVHLLDKQGNIIAQRDQEPQSGNYPTSIWSAGEAIRDDYQLDLARGDWSAYRLEIGMYLQGTGERLALLGGTGAPVADSLVVPLQLTGNTK